MKRLTSLLVVLLSVIFIVHAKNERTDLPSTAASTSQKEISAKLNELDARLATLKTDLEWSNTRLKMRAQQ